MTSFSSSTFAGWTEEELNVEFSDDEDVEEQKNDIACYFGRMFYGDAAKHLPISLMLLKLMIVMIGEKGLIPAVKEAVVHYAYNMRMGKGPKPSQFWILPRYCTGTDGGLLFRIVDSFNVNEFICSSTKSDEWPVFAHLESDVEDWLNSNLRFDHPGSSSPIDFFFLEEKINELLQSISLTDNDIDELHQRLCSLGE